MRHDETPKVDETDVHLSSEHYCPPVPDVPRRRGTTFIHARPEDYVTEEHPRPSKTTFQRFCDFETAINPFHVLGLVTGWYVGQLIW